MTDKQPNPSILQQGGKMKSSRNVMNCKKLLAAGAGLEMFGACEIERRPRGASQHKAASGTT
ncbi:MULTISPECIES: hypothetical protein [unclassified Pseudomonas]|uniref:hypothetical protein n=1 Tax=unclassified Pseudomonas TaxID=196821 RepID=UPI00117AA062|nr:MULTISPECIES: hypothetical protein [unclassified Pseudomonas]